MASFLDFCHVMSLPQDALKVEVTEKLEKCGASVHLRFLQLSLAL